MPLWFPLGGRVALREPFESVEHYVVRKRDLIDWEVALEHAPVRAELLNTIADDRSDGRGQLFGTDRPRPGMPVEAQPRHSDKVSYAALAIAGRILKALTAPLALGLAGDVYVVITKIAESPVAGLTAGTLALVSLIGLWYAYPLLAASVRTGPTP
jgi:hypothetical protein